MPIREIHAEHQAVVLVPASQISDDTVIKTQAFANVIVYNDNWSINEIRELLEDIRRGHLEWERSRRIPPR